MLGPLYAACPNLAAPIIPEIVRRAYAAFSLKSKESNKLLQHDAEFAKKILQFPSAPSTLDPPLRETISALSPMKIKNKGKVHPSPSHPPHSDSDSPSRLSLQLLPAAILTLISVLSFEDREVLAYMIGSSQDKSKKLMRNNNNRSNSSYEHGFHCDCFDCYRSYWFKWDSSPNRDLIHQAIEAFEDHQATPNNKTNRRLNAPKPPSPVRVPECHVEAAEVKFEEEEELGALVVRAAAASEHKGLVRKVLPDVMGIFNSRLWSLWSPNA